MKQTVIVCDVCGKRVEQANEGTVKLNGRKEIRFDICTEDTDRFFASLKPVARRGRPVAA